MYRLLPFLFLMAVLPESDKKLENINSLVLATKESVMSIKNGMDTFHSTMMPFMMAQARTEPEKTNQSP